MTMVLCFYGNQKSSRSVESISVHAYLVVNRSVSSDIVEFVNRSIERYIAELPSSNSSLAELDFIHSGVTDTPFDVHYLVTWGEWNRFIARALNASGQIWFFVIMLAIAILVIFARFYLNRKKYDSTGVINQNSWSNRFLNSVFVFSKYAVGIAIWFATLVLFSRIIVWQEQMFASLRGIESPLEGFGIVDSTIWLIKTAFTTLPTEIPLSLTSSVLIPATVLLGLGAFLHPVHVGFSAYERGKKKVLSGGGDYSDLEKHVVVCGWNERASGVIFSLISNYSPESKTVVVIAEIEGDTPLVDRGFESKRVHFVRGDAANTDVLRRAGAGTAAEAIVLACDSKRDSKNKDSILNCSCIKKPFEFYTSSHSK